MNKKNNGFLGQKRQIYLKILTFWHSVTIILKINNRRGAEMERIGYLLLALAAIIWIVLLFIGLISLFPAGLIGLLALIGVGLLLAKVIKDRINNKDDDYYSKNIKE